MVKSSWWLPVLFLTLVSCQSGPLQRDSFTWEKGEELLQGGIFRTIKNPPEYIVLEGYPSEFRDAIAAGIDVARDFFGNHGPVRVYILGQTDGEVGTASARQQFVDEYCRLRLEDARSGYQDDCLDGPGKRLIDVAMAGDQEAYLSIVVFTKTPYAELTFINADDWGTSDLPVRGIHEYTHVFQHVYPEVPGWLMEGGAVFFEAWLGGENGWVDFPRAMKRSMESAQQGRAKGRGLADMEYVRDLPEEMEPYHRSIAYDMGAWAVTYLISRSESRSIERFRDEFFPLLRQESWQQAVSGYTGTEDIAEFYAHFEEFLGQPLEDQMKLLEKIKS
ncbi:MAG: hypothetical protein VX764_07375 [Planctomycetota bacterium]|nr:hypothetical protein [Planctomycetota bacterium]